MDLESNIGDSKYFKWKEALFLPSWNTYHTPSYTEIQNIIKLALTMDKVRDLLNVPIIVHCWVRPILNNPDSQFNNQDYNKHESGALHSAHKVGCAVDFNPQGMACNDGKKLLLPLLDQLGLRLEDNGNGAMWIHLDNYPPNPNRFFKP